MKKLILVLYILNFLTVNAQNINCALFCVLDIFIDSATGEMVVVIANNDSTHVNYPVVQVIDSNGDTIGNSSGIFNFFAHIAGVTLAYNLPATVSSLPLGFTGTVILHDPLWNNTCLFNYPMNCIQPPDCDDLIVESIQIDSIAGTMDITLFNHCTNCASGNMGPVYCEMKVIRLTAPFDTIAEANCFCFVTPENQSSSIYTITTYVNQLPPLHELKIIFHCGSGLCDSLSTNPALNIPELYKENNLSIYPNPVNDVLFISSENGEIGEIRIFDVTGRIIYRELHPDFSTGIDIQFLSPGIYIFNIQEYRVKITKL